MSPSRYLRPATVEEAVALVGPQTRFIAGGTNLIDLMQEQVMNPEQLIDISALPLKGVYDTDDGGLHLGALNSNTGLAWNPRVQARYPLLTQAILAGAAPYLRNKATLGGNLLQRTRCCYFYDINTPCNKRHPGTGCAALNGINRIHAILGASEQCVAVNPSDLCVALAALEAKVLVQGPGGIRQIPMAAFHRLPGEHPEQDNTLCHGELVTGVDLPPSALNQHSAYLKIRDRSAHAFARVSVAAALSLEAGRICQARIALGGVAHKPWRQPEVEDWLVGQQANEALFDEAAQLLLMEARPLVHNAFKVPLAHQSIVRALAMATRGTQLAR